MSQFQVTKYCGSSKPFLVHPAKYICKTAVMKIPKNCPQWNTERCLLRETLSMIFQFHLRVSHPSSLLRNSLGPLVFPPSASKNLLYCWDACIKPFEKKRINKSQRFLFRNSEKIKAQFFPIQSARPPSVPGMVERDVKRGDQGSGGGWCERLVYCWVKHGGFGGRKLRKLPLQEARNMAIDGKIHHFLNIWVLDFERLFFLLSQC